MQCQWQYWCSRTWTDPVDGVLQTLLMRCLRVNVTRSPLDWSNKARSQILPLNTHILLVSWKQIINKLREHALTSNCTRIEPNMAVSRLNLACYSIFTRKPWEAMADFRQKIPLRPKCRQIQFCLKTMVKVPYITSDHRGWSTTPSARTTNHKAWNIAADHTSW